MMKLQTHNSLEQNNAITNIAIQWFDCALLPCPGAVQTLHRVHLYLTTVHFSYVGFYIHILGIYILYISKNIF